MAVFNVSSASQLASAINAARGGDEIRLAAGNYGTLNLSKKFSGNVTITSASDSNKAVFTTVKVNGAANVTFDGIKFDSKGVGELVRVDNASNVTFRDSIFDGHLKDGTGSGKGLIVHKSSGVTVQNSDFFDFQFGLGFSRVTNFNVSGNDLRSMKHDGMDFAQVVNGTIANNHFHDMKSEKGYSHKDMIQFWTSPAEGPSKNVTITGNRMDSPDGETHGIFMGNAQARGGDLSKFYQDFVIENNYIRTSQVHGLSVEHIDGLTIRNNTLIHNKDAGQTKTIAIPLINVSPNSRDVDIVNNTAPSLPDQGNSTWLLTGNKETYAGRVIHWTGSINGQTLKGTPVKNTGSTAGASGTSDAAPPAPEPTPEPDGTPDVFRFTATLVAQTSKTSIVHDLDFGTGDTLVFNHYASGTFRDFAGGNIVWNNAEGTYVVVDSLEDLRELDVASPAIRLAADAASDILTLHIAQGARTHSVQLHGLADAFLDL